MAPVIKSIESDSNLDIPTLLFKGISLDSTRLLSIKELILNDKESRITSLAPLKQLVELEILYASNNGITDDMLCEIDGLEKLRVLHLSQNKIRKFTIQNLPSLEELNLARQKSSSHSTPLQFDAESLETLSNTLRKLVLRGNYISVSGVYAPLHMLEELDLSENAIEHLSDFEILLACLSKMKVFNILNNPIAKKVPLRRHCISSWDRIESFNTKPIGFAERVCVTNMNEQRIKIKQARSSTSSRQVKTLDEPEMLSSKPLPHLPPYASQYRDLMVQSLLPSKTARGA
ncbi:hypothetical protein SmJEL517_g06201 [Synchytrium microbalum]|uniref:U2A'/phosphoprotein 32 family A C-terminal domain-containing protein n=1 Tax=Synchytrium microbalum TaxID=1806994 RepID=A0A507BXV0_9FUNG|nr:uncharacterized protein SmJEL517_g06201 [Synchytrium microbalum]TPX30175.1 hypothetical protein SmJEL517_g06201 [Synchytrium microbalum]